MYIGTYPRVKWEHKSYGGVTIRGTRKGWEDALRIMRAINGSSDTGGGGMKHSIGTCDQCAYWTDFEQLDGTSRGRGRCLSGKHVASGWVTDGDESSLIHHAEGCDCSRSVVQTGPKYGCIHFRSNSAEVR